MGCSPAEHIPAQHIPDGHIPDGHIPDGHIPDGHSHHASRTGRMPPWPSRRRRGAGQPPVRRRRARLGAAGGLALALALSLGACSSSTPTTASAAASASSASPGTASSSVVHRQLVIETGKADGRPGWPRYVPDGFTAPVGTTIVLTIVNHDDGAAPLPPDSPWGQVWGSDPTYGAVSGGTEQVGGKTVTAIPNQDVSHTFEIPGLLLNIPIPAAPSSSQPVTVVFTFTVLKRGTYLWICAAPCGGGAAGMGGAMTTDGWMRGHVTFS